MRILVISDLHICADPSMDKFGWNINEFLDKLNYHRITLRADEVIVAGDAYEMYFFTEKEIRESNDYIYFTFNHDPRYKLLKGNHDRLTDNPSSYIFENVYIEHGEKGTIYGIPVIGFIIEETIRFLDFFNKKIPALRDRYIKKYRNNIDKYNNEGAMNTLSMMKRVFKLFHKYDIVVMGHSHTQQKLEFNYKGGKKIYANTGTCSNHRFEAVFINTETGSVELIKE